MTNTILNSLVDNAGDFKRVCEIKITSETLLDDLDKALEYGLKLQEGIETIMSDLRFLKVKMETD